MAGTLGPNGTHGASRTSPLPRTRGFVGRYRWELAAVVVILALAVALMVVELTRSSNPSIPTVNVSSSGIVPAQSAEIVVPGAQELSPLISPILAGFVSPEQILAANAQAPAPVLGTPVAGNVQLAGTA